MYEAKFMGGGPLSRKKMMVRDKLPLQVARQRPMDWSFLKDDGAPSIMPNQYGMYDPWAIDESMKRIVYVWVGWSR